MQTAACRNLEVAQRPDPAASARVYVVDRDRAVRESIETMGLAAGWETRAFATPATFLEDDSAGGPCCLVLDTGGPEFEGLDLQARVARERSEMPVIVTTHVPDVRATVRAMKTGAIEFLLKPFRDEVLRAAIALAIELSSQLVTEQEALRRLRERRQALSNREREVMALVVVGRLNKQIAFDLGISEVTVKAHRGRVMEKMQARSLADLVRMSGALGLP